MHYQNYEINNATLTERNRIAREIHDNVGHMLSRAIMITGAIKVVNKNENLYNSIDNLEECLSNAMTNIRESVHNLHNNSISLQNAVQKIVDDFKFCNINLTYDMTDHIPNDVKYAFITIIKESLTNIEKHSNKEIAANLYLSEGTVRNYLSTILDKLGLRDRTQLAIFYYKHNKKTLLY
jgi:hypothetical protein